MFFARIVLGKAYRGLLTHLSAYRARSIFACHVDVGVTGSIRKLISMQWASCMAGHAARAEFCALGVELHCRAYQCHMRRYALHVTDNLPLHVAAPLLCAGITVYSPMMHYGLNKPGMKLGVVGLGRGGPGRPWPHGRQAWQGVRDD